MLDGRTQSLLESIVRRQSRSLLQYVDESFPWTPEREEKALAEVRRLAAEERLAVAGLVRVLSRNHLGMPYLGSYPTGFTTSNYVSLDHLLPRLVTDETQALARLEADRPQLGDPAALTAVDHLLESKRCQVKVLQELAAANHAPATVN